MVLIPAALVDLVIAEMFGDSNLLMTRGNRMVTTPPVLAREWCSIGAVQQLLGAPPGPVVAAEGRRSWSISCYYPRGPSSSGSVTFQPPGRRLGFVFQKI